MTKPSDDEGLHIVRDAKPRVRLFQEDISSELPTTALRASRHWNLFRLKRVGIIIGIVLVLAFIAAGVAYWIDRHRYPVVVTIGLPNKRASENSLADQAARLVPVTPDQLQ